MGKLVYGPPGVNAPATQPIAIPRHPDSAASHFLTHDGGTRVLMSPSHMKAQRMMGNMVKSVLPLLFRASIGMPFVFQTASPNKSAVTAIIKALLSHIPLSPHWTFVKWLSYLYEPQSSMVAEGCFEGSFRATIDLPAIHNRPVNWVNPCDFQRPFDRR